MHWLNHTQEDLKNIFKEKNIDSFRLKQIWHWVYHHGVKSFDEMNNLPQSLKQTLKEEFIFERPALSMVQTSVDGTQKWLLKFKDGNEVESVHIPETNRGTLCVSSQVGCTLTCKFCHTGTQPFVRNLTAQEIVNQVMVARDIFGEWSLAPNAKRHVSHIVMMGMGEPLFNYDNVAKALKILMTGLDFSPKKITLSTAGVVPMIHRCGEELGVNLAISLHAVRDELRDILVPLNKKYPLKELIHACKTYPSLKHKQKITFEYVMLQDVNDTPQDARELIRLIKGIPSKINLIPFNPWPGSSFECSSKRRIQAFASIIEDAGYMAPVRTPRGQDILAACGQLKSESQKIRKSDLLKRTACAS